MMHQSLERLRARVEDSIEIKRRLLDSPVLDRCVEAAEAIWTSLSSGGKAIFFGNGGSSMDAGHLAAELLGRFYEDRAPLAAMSLADVTAAVTAIGNDYSYGEIFERQLRGVGRPGDVAIGLTTSGNSENVVRALRAGQELGLVTISMTGANGGKVAKVSDITIAVPTLDTPRVQEVCMLLGHTICEIVELEALTAAG